MSRYASPRNCFGIGIVALRWAGLLALTAVFSLASAPLYADDILGVTVPTVTLSGNNVCGPAKNAACVESFSGFFQWDDTTQSVVSGTAHIATAGPLGTFSFFESLFVGSGPSGGELLGSIWTNSAGDELVADIVAPPTGLSPGTYPIVGPFAPGEAGAGLGCNEVPVDKTCFADFIGLSTREFSPLPMVVGSVPEVPTAFMLVLGVVALALWRGRRFKLADG